jgi:hypothetical protein
MDKKERLENQTSQLYQSYGKFAVEFEQMCMNIRTCITFAMHIRGLKDQELIRILLVDHTASPLISKLRSIIAILYKDEPDSIKHIDPLFKFCININERRNEIIHGSWFIGWGSTEQEDFHVATGLKDKITKKGVELNVLSYENVNFDELTEKIIIAKNLLSRLNDCIVKGYSVLKNLDSEEFKKLK